MPLAVSAFEAAHGAWEMGKWPSGWLPGHLCKFASVHVYLLSPGVKQAVAVNLSNCAALWGKQRPVPASLISAEFSWIGMSVLKPSDGAESCWEWYVARCFAKSLLSTVKHSSLTVLCTHDIGGGFTVLIMFVLTVSVSRLMQGCMGNRTNDVICLFFSLPFIFL